MEEKPHCSSEPVGRPPSRQRPWSWICFFAVCGAMLFGLDALRRYSLDQYLHDPVNHLDWGETQTQTQPLSKSLPESWSDIVPSERLQWHPCPIILGAGLQCARLTVPMDYHRPLNESSDNPKVHIALVMTPGANRTADPSTYSESPLIINPGGPGGSGTVFGAAGGRSLQMTVGDHHDIVGFDPRGVGATTPKADCFASPDDPQGLDGRNVAYLNRLAWQATGHDVGIANSSNVALSKLNARAKAVAKLCRRVDQADGENSIFRHSSTPNVARDMLSIIHAWDEWRTTSALKPAKSMQRSEAADPSEELQTGPKIASQKSTKGKLVYWGFSYGSLLGATFASMFPDKVGRVILDGIVDADHYVGPIWMDSIVDADEIWGKFFVYCAEATVGCPFYRLGDQPEDIKERFDEIMTWLEQNPAVVLSQASNTPLLVTTSDLKKIIFSALYAPVGLFHLVATILKLLVDGQMGAMVSGAAPVALCHNITLAIWPDDAMKAIGCSDKRYKLNEDVPRLQERFETIASYSSFADVWISVDINVGCNGWEIDTKDPPMRWDDHPAHKPTPIETGFPLLFLSNHLDPVTPLQAALKMARKFANASIVEQGAEGHCTISCASLCTVNHIRAYLNDGVVPPAPKFDPDDHGEWVTCECKGKPWKPAQSFDDDQETTKAMRAYRDLGSIFAAHTMHQQLSHDNPLKDLFFDASKDGFLTPKVGDSS
ncbi:TAP-like protein-domain-containing protein [Biscogniauxia mediterranea]|nr:TAP-like protein-domain-containing protein [Biscogniauxia mediterranea]